MNEFTQSEERYMQKMTSIFENLLIELQSKGHIKEVVQIEQIRAGKEIIQMIDNFSLAYNSINEIFQHKKEAQFAKIVESLGISETNISYIWYNLALSGFVNQVELLKTCMLLILLTEKPPRRGKRRSDIIYDDETLGSLLHKLSRLSKYGKELKKEINNELRNAVVHGWYWIGNGTMYYSRDPIFSNVQSITLADFITKQAKRHNLISQSFIRFFPRWFKEGRRGY
jgi:hypothetical protein